MNGPTRRVALVMLAGFSALLLTVTWVQAIAAETYRDDPRNARTALSEAGKERGLIVAADG
ncbi:MAG TPA: penicillin-binding protein 2, partial [Acidimicrobiia bacterium]|nr:penicillin-binding protein 2 [Acidimicrobiia bacterium]